MHGLLLAAAWLEAGVRRRTTASLMSVGAYSQALMLMEQVRADLGDDIRSMDGPTLSVYGSAHLRSAILAARASRTDAPGYAQDAWAHMAAARAAATQMGSDRNDYGLAFGPSNVAQHEVAVAVELEDGAEAVRRGSAVRRLSTATIRVPIAPRASPRERSANACRNGKGWRRVRHALALRSASVRASKTQRPA